MTAKQLWQAASIIVLVFVLLIVLLVVLRSFGGDSPQPLTLAMVFQTLVAVVLALFAGVVLAMMLNGRIDLSKLISEDNGNASLSRFQFLIFTFVIAASYFLMLLVWLAQLPELMKIASTAAGKLGDATANASEAQKALAAAIANVKYELPNIPAGVLALIGISGGSYVVAKGIQKSSETDGGLSVVRIDISDPGVGYAVGHVAVDISGGGGTNATAFANVTAAAGGIASITVSSPGNSYATPPTVTIAAPTGVGGRQATAKAVLG